MTNTTQTAWSLKTGGSVLKIYAFTAHRPEFIDLQLKCFQKHLQEEFVFTIFNNSNLDCMRVNYNPINEACKKSGVQVIDIQKDVDLIARCQSVEKSCPVFDTQGENIGNYPNSNCAGCYAACYAWERVISKETSPILLLHPDVFMVQPSKLTDYLKDYTMGFVSQSRPGLGGNYMHDVCVLADMSKVPEPSAINWWGGRINGCPVDIGGQTFHYFKKHPEIKFFGIRPEFVADDPALDFHPSEYEILRFVPDEKAIFLHYFRGSNWDLKSPGYHVQKEIWLRNILGV